MPSYIPPVIHAAGDTFDVTDYNTVANNTTAILNAPSIAVYATVGTSMATGTNVQMMLAGVLFSSYGAKLASNAVVVPLAGIYAVYFGVSLYTSGVGYLQSHMEKNGAVQVYGWGGATGSLLSTSPGAVLLSCNANDLITLWGYHTSGGTLVSVPSSQTTFLHVQFVGSS